MMYCQTKFGCKRMNISEDGKSQFGHMSPCCDLDLKASTTIFLYDTPAHNWCITMPCFFQKVQWFIVGAGMVCVCVCVCVCVIMSLSTQLPLVLFSFCVTTLWVWAIKGCMMHCWQWNLTGNQPGDSKSRDAKKEAMVRILDRGFHQAEVALGKPFSTDFSHSYWHSALSWLTVDVPLTSSSVLDILGINGY